MGSSVREAALPPTTLTIGQYRCLAAGMVVFAVYGSLIPFGFRPRSFDDAIAAFRSIQLHDPTDLAARGDWAVSVVLFLAVSYLLMAALSVDRPRRTGILAAPAVVLLTVVLVLVIEFVQLFFPPRTVSLNDIIVETIGAFGGTLLWLAGGQRITQWVRRLTAPTGLSALAARLMPGYLVVLLVLELMPFDVTVSPEELAVKLEEGKIRLIPFARYAAEPLAPLLVKLAINLACFFPLGLLRAMAVPSVGARNGTLRIVGLGLAVTGAIELLQMAVYSRVCDTTDVITGTLATVLGWHAGRLSLAAWRDALARSQANPVAVDPDRWRRRALVAGLFFAWLAGVLYLNWTPFNFTVDPRQFHDGWEELSVRGLRRMIVLPFVDYYWGSKYQALDQFIKKCALFVPLGVLGTFLSPRVYRRGTLAVVLLAALSIGLVVEAGRYFLPGRSVSVTDVLLQCVGAWIGFRLAQHVRALLWAESALYGYLYCQH